MKRSLWVLGALVIPVFAAHLALAAGFFKVGEKAPSFTLTAITGETVSLDAYKGKVIVLGLFHICDPCMMQGSTLQKVSELTKGKEVAVVGVNSSGDSKKSVGEFLSAFPCESHLSLSARSGESYRQALRRREVYSQRVCDRSGRGHPLAARREHGSCGGRCDYGRG